MGYDRKPEQRHYWAKDTIYGSTVVPNIMKSDRYFEVLRYLHFCGAEDEDETDKLKKLRSVWEEIVSNFASVLTPYEYLCIDESLVLFKGRLHFRQYIPSKRSRFGIKLWRLVDAVTGFILDCRIYEGKRNNLNTDAQHLGVGGSIVVEMTQKYFNRNQKLYVDNFFSSPNLAVILMDNKTALCGTCKPNRKNLPQQRMKEKLKKGDVRVFSCNNIMVERWKDKRVVTMISTGDEHDMIARNTKSGNARSKPKSVLCYNQLARGIDRADQLMHYYDLLRKTKIWYKKLFFHLMDTCIFNSYKLFQAFNPGMTFLKFRMNIVSQIMGSVTPPVIARHSESRLNGRHFLIENRLNNKLKPSLRRCKVCSSQSKEKRTKYCCETCDIPLCVTPCFQKFHTVKVY